MQRSLPVFPITYVYRYLLAVIKRYTIREKIYCREWGGECYAEYIAKAACSYVYCVSHEAGAKPEKLQQSSGKNHRPDDGTATFRLLRTTGQREEY